MTDQPHVGIIVLNWNGQADTLACLASLERLEGAAVSVIVVDNGSTDDSVASIRRQFPGVTVLETGRNLGFAGGNNVGLQHVLNCGLEYALLLNNDTEVAPDMVRLLVEAAERNTSVGMAGPTIYFHEARETVWSAGGCIDRRAGQTRMLDLGQRDTGQWGDAPREVDFVTGCALLIKRAVLERIGLLDERFFVYYEETEWCVRARRAGYCIVHVPQARMWHKIPLDGRAESPLVHYYMTRNRLLFLRLAGAGPQAWLRTLADDGRMLASWTLKPQWRGKRAHRDAMLDAIGDALRGRWGKRPTGRVGKPECAG